MTTITGAAAAVAASAIIAVLGFLPGTATPIAAADVQHPAAPTIGENDQSPNPQDCAGGPYDTVCTRTGDAKLRSTPKPADIPKVPQAETMTPWVILGNPGIGHH
ncbi:hypothetical protein [Mycobacteroides abscessus]|uniref:hypothetical protein n=1 Tax=Mycobacteroides abscessus TaxID=36809 RepID=UPI000C25A9CA|nr:hypothetical protein [Mycobacteroides abscessus]MBE5458400.1 hypothetical protein [Mycobacteroides abscessus]QOF45154.1 hypothetical protein E3G69_004211 [Mycobacteroides abscessus]QOF49852.1 hypothetical protein E3G70_004209 [Mycobacteroides abscessus]